MYLNFNKIFGQPLSINIMVLKSINIMVLKTETMKELEKLLVTYFMVWPMVELVTS